MSGPQTTYPLNADTSIPAVGFGTYLISNDDAETAIRSAIATGYRHIDTASGYHNEETVGAGIRKGLQAEGLSRADLFVTAKLWPGNPAWGDAPKTGAQTLEECRWPADARCQPDRIASLVPETWPACPYGPARHRTDCL